MQLGVDHLLGLGQNVDQVLGLDGVSGGEESVGGSGLVPAAGSSDSVNVVFGVVGVVVVDDELDVINVEASSGDVRGDEDGGASLLELCENPVAFLLLLVAVDAHRRVPFPPHQPGEVVSLPLGLHEDENLVVRFAPDLLKEPGKLLLFLVFFADVDLTD